MGKLLDEYIGDLVKHVTLKKGFHVNGYILMQPFGQGYDMVVGGVFKDGAGIVQITTCQDNRRANQDKPFQEQFVLQAIIKPTNKSAVDSLTAAATTSNMKWIKSATESIDSVDFALVE